MKRLNYRKKLPQGFLIIIVVVFLGACTAPQLVTKLEPEAPEGYIEHGREYITLSNDSIYAILGFDGLHDETMIFDLVVINNSNKLLNIDPGVFYYEILDSAMEMSSRYPAVNALKPDDVSGKYDVSVEEMKSHQNTNAFFGILEAAAGIAFNTAGFITTEDPGYIFDLIAGTLNTADFYITRDKQLEKDISNLIDEKKMVRQATHDSRTLDPGESVSGFVFFPQKKDAQYYMFCFPIEEELFQFVYHQDYGYRF